jgi:hypothetical protein
MPELTHGNAVVLIRQTTFEASRGAKGKRI